MAKCTSSSSNFSSIPITPHKSISKELLSISFSYHIISIKSSYRKLIIIDSTNASSPILETSSDLQVIELPSNLLPNSKFSNKFIRGLCKNPQTQVLAFDHYQKAKTQIEFRLEPSTLNTLISTLVKLKQWASIPLLLKDINDLNIYPSTHMSTILVTRCISARKFKLVEAFILILQNKQEGSNVLVFCAAMRGYNKLHMYSSTVIVFNTMKNLNVSLNPNVYYLIMDAYRKLGDPDKVLSLFLEYESKNIVTPLPVSLQIYSVLCDSLGRSGRAFQALRYFREMIEKGISPNTSLYTSLICSFAAIKEAEIAEDLFLEGKRKGMVKDPAVYLKLVVMYVELGLLEKTIGIVNSMKESKIKVSDCILCAIINGYASKKGLRASLKAYEQLISLECEMGQVTYASIINVYCRLGLISKAEATFNEMIEKGYDRCVVAYSNVISMYGKNGKAREAMRLLAKMKEKKCEPNVWVYNSLLDMHGKLLNLKQVDKLWKEMKRRGVMPDKVSYTSIINAYSKAKEYDVCLKYYYEYKKSGGKVDRVFAGIMVGLFSKSSRIDEVIMLLQDMKEEKLEVDERLYKSVLNALRDAGLQSRVKWLEESFGYLDEKKKFDRE